MAEQFQQLEDRHIDFVKQQHIFFVGTAGPSGSVNVSPKGMDSFRILQANRVAWLNVTGSGNETAAHVLQDPRMTIMFCSFERQPLILRLYGQARAVHPPDRDWSEYAALFPDLPGARQIFAVDLEMVQTSCGYAVPLLDYKAERETLNNWADRHGPEGIRAYWKDKNGRSIDGFPTGMVDAT